MEDGFPHYVMNIMKKDKKEKTDSRLPPNHYLIYNKDKELWAAIPRDKIEEYLSNPTGRVIPKILYSEEIVTLIKLLTKKK